MREMIEKGHLMAFVIMISSGIPFFLSTKAHPQPDKVFMFFLVAMIVWIITILILLLRGFVDLDKRNIAEPVYIVGMAVFSTCVQLYWSKGVLIFLLFILEWMSVIMFLNKKYMHMTVGVQICCMAFFIFAPNSMVAYRIEVFNGRSLLFISFAMLVVDWIGCSVVSAIEQMNDEKEEHERSLDDLVSIVEAKHIEAKNATKSKSQFLSNMSHEIRTPLNSIVGMNEMILRENADPNIRKYATNVKKSSDMLLALINDILDFSRIESGRMELIPVNFKLSDVIGDISNMISPKAKAKNLEYKVDIDESLHNGYFGDDVRIRQILVNLLTNAIKYTQEGYVHFTVTGENVGNYEMLHFSVEDSGIGIKPEDIEKLNKKFVRVDEGRNRNIEGTGLGMVIVSEFLRMMDSKIEISSEYGKGSVFEFTLKLRLVPPEAFEEPVMQKPALVRDVSGKRILVVDDVELNIVVLEELLKGKGLIIDSAASGMKALELTKENKYDLIFMDHMMPGMDGIETFHAIREDEKNKNADTEVVVLTANAISGAKEEYIKEGFARMLTKPVVPDKLDELIQEMLGD